VTLTGSTANTYAGLTTVSSGTLVLSKSYAVHSVPGNLAINNGSTARLASSEQTSYTADILVDGGGLFDFFNFRNLHRYFAWRWNRELWGRGVDLISV